MREIKFRAWDKKEKHFVYFELFSGVNNHTPPIYEDADLENWEQFTGLFDKNGKEIYEGDIVEYKILTGFGCEDDDFRNSQKAIIKRAEIVFRNGKFTPREDCSVPDDAFYAWRTFDFEVIGNIYENPELLK